VRAKYAFAHGNFVADRPRTNKFAAYFKMLQIGAAQGIDGIGSLIAPVPTSFISRMALEAASDKRIRGMHYYSVLRRRRREACHRGNHKLTTGQFTLRATRSRSKRPRALQPLLRNLVTRELFAALRQGGWLRYNLSRFRLRRYTSGHRRGSHGSCADLLMLTIGDYIREGKRLPSHRARGSEVPFGPVNGAAIGQSGSVLGVP